jgi:hypothetical protein
MSVSLKSCPSYRVGGDGKLSADDDDDDDDAA